MTIRSFALLAASASLLFKAMAEEPEDPTKPPVEKVAADVAEAGSAVTDLTKALLATKKLPEGGTTAVRKSLTALDPVLTKFATVVQKTELDPYTAAMVTLDASRKRMWSACDALDEGDTATALSIMGSVGESLLSISKNTSLTKNDKTPLAKSENGAPSMSAKPAVLTVKMTRPQVAMWVTKQIEKAASEEQAPGEARLKHLSGVLKALSVEETSAEKPLIPMEMESAYAPNGPWAGKVMDLTATKDQSFKEMMDAPAQAEGSTNFASNALPTYANQTGATGSTTLDVPSQPESTTNFSSNGLQKFLSGVSELLKAQGIEPTPPAAAPAAPVAKALAPKGEAWPMDINKAITYAETHKDQSPIRKQELVWGSDPKGLRGLGAHADDQRP